MLGRRQGSSLSDHLDHCFVVFKHEQKCGRGCWKAQRFAVHGQWHEWVTQTEVISHNYAWVAQNENELAES